MNTYRQNINVGMVVRSMDGERLGKVYRLESDAFLIEKGLFFTKDYLVRYEDVSEIRDKEIILKHGHAALRELSDRVADTAPLGQSVDLNNFKNNHGLNFDAGRTADTLRTDTRDTSREGELRVPVVEEELSVEHHVHEAGAVRVRKEVVVEQRQITVPVRREEVIVERVPVSERTATAADANFNEEEIVVAVQEEEIEIHKRPVVREEVHIRKEVHRDQQTANTSVRHEEVKVEDKTNRTREGIVIKEDGPKSSGNR